MPQPYEAGKGMLSMGAGTFQGQTAIAMGVAKAFGDGHTVVKLGATYNSRGMVGANGGIGYQF
jgi:autotransporter adhesin